MPVLVDDEIAAAVRDQWQRVLASLVRTAGSVQLAEDALADAVLRAWERWPVDGVPDNPRAWLTVAARRRAIDLLRREAARAGKEVEAVRLDALGDPDPEPDSVVADDLLRLIFTCCHPALALDAQVALTLRTLGGLTTEEVARALLVPTETMAKRLTRVKQKIARAGIPYRVPGDAELPDRLDGVATTVYLMFNEGYTAGAGAVHVRTDLAEQAIRLGRLLVELMPDEAGLQGLQALMLLQHARRDARLDAAGGLVLLADQDRSRWDADAVREGVVLVGRALARTPDRPDRHVVQAAIAACHALAPTWADTDWPAVVSWYDVLLTVQDDEVVRLNRAAALAERDGPGAALPLLDALTGLGRYPLWHASRAELLHRLGRHAEAVQACDAALALDLTDAQRALLTARRDAARAAAPAAGSPA